MANRQQVRIIQSGVADWNKWRVKNPDVRPDLSEATLSNLSLLGADLRLATLARADLSGSDLTEANLYMATLAHARLVRSRLRHTVLVWSDLTEADLSFADLHRADMQRADLRGANLLGADLTEANFDRADLSRANLTGVDLTWAALIGANMVGTTIEQAILSETAVYGVAAWDLKGSPRTQRDLVISPHSAVNEITVDDLEIAQFIYLLLNNDKVRNAIDSITSKVVLILGRFSPSRKVVLDSLREALRRHNFVPLLFDFASPASKDTTGAVETIARMARFVVADLTDPSSVPHELATIVPFLRTTPVVPLRLVGASGYSMFDDLRGYPWVLPTHEYAGPDQIVGEIEEVIIGRAEELRRTLNRRSLEQ